MIKIVKLIVEPFGLNIDVFVNVKTEIDLQNIRTYIESENTVLEDFEFSEDDLHLNGSYYYFNCQEGIYRCIFLREFKQSSISDIQNITHELYHALVHILDQVEIKTNDKFNELMAYLLDCNLGKFLTAIKIKNYEKL